MQTTPKIGQRIYHPDCGMGIVVYVEADRVAALWERAEERREVPIARCGLTACNACLGAADDDGFCLEGCCDDDDTRCVGCVMDGCHGPEGGEDCPCNYACHDSDAETQPMERAAKVAVLRADGGGR